MDTIRRLDTTIALDIIDRYNTNGHVYIPNELVPYSPNRIVLASCDNIDVLEETIDGEKHISLHTNDAMAKRPC